MVLVPFETATETEQRIRAERLASLGLAEAVWESELAASSLAGAIDRAWRSPARGERRAAPGRGSAQRRLAAALAAIAGARLSAPPEPAR